MFVVGYLQSVGAIDAGGVSSTEN